MAISDRVKALRPNSLSYKGRIMRTPVFSKNKRNTVMLELHIAEGFERRNDKLPPEKQDPNKAPDAYVRISSAWHQITIFGTKAEELAQDPDINEGGYVAIFEATYEEDTSAKAFIDKNGVKRISRRETLFADDSTADVEVMFGPYADPSKEPAPAVWDGLSDIPERHYNSSRTAAADDDLGKEF